MQKKNALVAASVLIASCLMASSLSGSAVTGGATLPSPSSEAVLLKAEGNTSATTDSSSSGTAIELAALYPWGYYETKAKCRIAGAGFLSQHPGRFLGYSCVRGTGANSNRWQLYMDENVCLDRVTGTAGIGIAKEDI